jgi:NADH:ubiquinone oxidoreductase subunit K
MTIGLGHYLAVAAILFTLGILGIFINRKNVIVILMSVELILLSVNINLVAFSTFLNDIVGQVFALLVLTVAAAEAAIGLAVLVVDAGVNLAAAVDYMAAIKRPVTVVATSRGTIRAAQGIAGGARPDALVLTSGFLTAGSGPGDNVASILGSPAALPRTLVIHHRDDSCRFTMPAGVAPFLQWAQGKARVAWLSGGASVGDPCEAMAHHGFNGLDGQVVRLAGGFR